MSPGAPSLSDTNRWFDHYDRNGSGHLDQEELVIALLTTFGGEQNSIRETVAAVFPAFDRDGSGTIDRNEFCGPGGMGESLLAAMQQRGSSNVPQQQARAYVPSAYVPQSASTHVQPSAPLESPGTSHQTSTSSANAEFWTCGRCTFINKASEPVCKACHSAQPNYQPPATQHQQTAPYVPSPPQHPVQPQPASVPTQTPYIPPQAATQSQHMTTPTPYQPQPQPQPAPQATTPNANNMQTFRVLIPRGMEPGQRITVETGSTNPPPTIVAIPARSRWGRSQDGQSYFDVQLRKEPAAKPIAVQGSYVAAPSSGTNTATYSHSTAPSHSQTRPPSQSQQASASSSAPARVSNPHLALISPQHVTSTATTLILKERSMSYSGDDAQIKDMNGNIVFYVQAELMTMSQRRYMVDSRGKRIGQLRHKKMPGLSPTVYVGTVSDEKKISVKMSGMLDPFNCNAKILLGENKKIGKVSGNWRAKKFSIEIDGSVVAKVLRKRTMSSVFMGADTYCIDVQPGVDMAFVSLIAIALDELYNDQRGGRQGGGGIGGSFGPGW